MNQGYCSHDTMLGIWHSHGHPCHCRVASHLPPPATAATPAPALAQAGPEAPDLDARLAPLPSRTMLPPPPASLPLVSVAAAPKVSLLAASMSRPGSEPVEASCVRATAEYKSSSSICVTVLTQPQQGMQGARHDVACTHRLRPSVHRAKTMPGIISCAHS